MTEMKIALSIEEAADYTGVGRNTLRNCYELNFKLITAIATYFMHSCIAKLKVIF